MVYFYKAVSSCADRPTSKQSQLVKTYNTVIHTNFYKHFNSLIIFSYIIPSTDRDYSLKCCLPDFP